MPHRFEEHPSGEHRFGEHRFGEHRFGDEEAQAILREAMHPTEPGMALDEIVLMGAELGIPEARIREAAERVRAGGRETEITAQYRRRARRGFAAHAEIYLGVNVLLMALCLAGIVPAVGMIGPIFGWGSGLTGHALGTFRESSEAFRKGLRQFAATKGETAPPPEVVTLSTL